MNVTNNCTLLFERVKLNIYTLKILRMSQSFIMGPYYSTNFSDTNAYVAPAKANNQNTTSYIYFNKT